MNVNPHLQYLQQHQLQLGSPQMGQMQMQPRVLHPQLQMPQMGTQMQSTANSLLAAIGSVPNYSHTQGVGQNVNPLLQLQLQQMQNQSVPQRLFDMHMMPPPQHQVPVIKEVWKFNLEHEFAALRLFIADKLAGVYISIHQEIPGIVARPVGTFKLSSDYHFQTLRLNLDLLSLIQLSLCAVKISGNDVSNLVIWQFNFLYDLSKEMFNEEHLLMLSQTAQINFNLHMSQGVPHLAFAELMIESGLLLDTSIHWVSYHLGYDLGFLVSLLTNEPLPNEEKEFFWWCVKYFPNFLDLKHIGNQLLHKGTDVGNGDVGKLTSNNKPSVEYLAEELHLLPISPMIRQYFAPSGTGFQGQPQMTLTLHAFLLMECFKEMYRQAGYDITVFDKYKGYLWGLGDTAEEKKW